jgi:endonuclease/exonuclease/phosphatase (EEP) superfamily protein YafD
MKISETILQGRLALSNVGLPMPFTRKRTTIWIWIAVGIFIVQVTGCIRIPKESWVISHRRPIETRTQTTDCTAACLDRSIPDHVSVGRMTPLQTVRAPELNSDGFNLVSWNIFKGKKKGWAEDFQKLNRNTDILILQEAYLSASLKNMLNQEKYQWDMTAAFEYREITSGVLTASKVVPNFTCAFRETEPISRIPKSVLITRYPMSGTDRELLVANIHAVNFTMGGSAFQRQSDRLENILAAHQGPLIVSGDFNTWNRSRMSYINAMAERLELTAVIFDENRRSQFLGQYIDHVYYRELKVKNASVPLVSTSDHNPLTVVFNLADDLDHGI